MTSRLLLLVLACSFLLCCESPQSRPRVAFYHWQTALELKKSEQEWLRQTDSQRLYVKFFDLVKEGNELVPHAKLHNPTPWSDSIEVVPTLFVTNASMQWLGEQEDGTIAALATRCHQLIGTLWPGLSYPEIQIDCDWTGSTRETYFQFLRSWRATLPDSVTLSVTLRLHQYRYPAQTGIPPADRVMLMYYNVGELDDWNEENSILRLEAAAPYLAADTYPLPLDLALPLFRWGVLFRQGKVLKLITNLNAERLADTTLFQEIRDSTLPSTSTPPSPPPSRFLVKKSTYLDGYYLYAEDLLRLEWIDSHLLLAAAQQWYDAGGPKPEHLAFYHLDEEVLTPFTFENLNACADIWRDH